MTTTPRRVLVSLLLLGSALVARAEIALLAFQPAAAAAIEALNARPDREKYMLSDKALSSDAVVPRVRRSLNIAKTKDAPLARTSLALVVDRKGNVVDAAAFAFNDQAFADHMVHRMVKDVPPMYTFKSNGVKKTERALLILTFNTHREDPEEYTIDPVRGR